MRLHNNKTALYRIGFIASENVYYVLRPVINISSILLAPAVTVGETEGAMDSTSVFLGLFFAYNFVRK